MDHRLLFVMGLARSGTTALTSLLNTHPDIALGMERFKSLTLHGPAHELRPELFETSRFFDFSDGLTNITPDASPRWRTYYEELAEKYDAATYVGDKVIGTRIGRILRRFPAAGMVVIVRDPVEVAASWQHRADNPDDQGWRADRGARESIVEWNRALRRLLVVMDGPERDRVRVVDHAGVFGDPSGSAVRRLFDWLGLTLEPAVAASIEGAHQRHVSLARQRTLAFPPGDREAVEGAVDRDAWRAVSRLVNDHDPARLCT